ncbi:Hpt domain-containing protein [Sulfurovum sp.]|uniref:Hpt domain-containing protein n=1 Tax=Sulfurovum sp. TaxID=1969726 RepID=UPI00286829A2|nr:Hpt domain-containing protein [Sulfurovum sp.]
MYYILNETNQIIAADTDLLGLCGLAHIDELTLSIALGETKFDLVSKENLVITTEDINKTYPASKTSLSSMLGHLTLVEVKKSEEKTEENIISLDLDSESLSINTDMDETSAITEPADDDNVLFNLDFDEEEEKAIENIEESPHILIDDTDTYDLDFLIKEEEPKEKEAKEEEEEAYIAEPEPIAEILIDIKKVSQQIGISEEDYDTFLNEYIDTALELEKDLQSSDTEKRVNAIETLSNLSDLLQLEDMSDIIAKIDTASQDKQTEIIESFYAALSRITTSAVSQTLEVLQEEPEIELFDTVEEVKPTVEVNKNGFGSISLEGIKPIHFDFRLEEAANDLSLPVDLIEEFVHDFIEQAHIETEKMLKAYEKGDLDAIQKIGHLLKGASSNLRINALSDTLYKIQFCEDAENLEHYIKDYWGHFLSFEIQINALAK